MDKKEAIELFDKIKKHPFYVSFDNEELKNINQNWLDEILLLYKKVYGKKTKNTLLAFKKLSNNPNIDIDEYRKPFKNLFEEKNKVLKENFLLEQSRMKDKLREFGKTYVPKKQREFVALKYSSVYEYNTQPSKEKYARGKLQQYAYFLKLFEFDTKIREELDIDYNDKTEYIKGYTLYSNISEFDFEILYNYSGKFISALNCFVIYWRSGVNPAVYFPFISHDDFDKSLKLYNCKKYEITLENMSLEPTWENIKNLTSSDS